VAGDRERTIAPPFSGRLPSKRLRCLTEKMDSQVLFKHHSN
jgi:hypothetical protein